MPEKFSKKIPDEWEQHYLEDDTPWDKGYAAPGLVSFLQQKHALTGRILVPGCGLGHDVRALAKAGGDQAEVIGFDLSPTAMARAKAFAKAGREQYMIGDFFDIPQEMINSFDWIWEHTCFCAIDPDRRKDYVQSAAHVLKQGGQLLAVFYLDPYDEEHSPGEGPPHGCTPEELEKLFGEDFTVIEHWQPDQAYPGREERELMMILQKR